MKPEASKTTTILVAEDSPTQALKLEHLLSGAGYRVEVAEDGQKGLETARRGLPSLIISDVMMPVMNGYELCQALKQDASTASIPVILLTALADLEDIFEGIEAQADYYVTKPYDAEYLLAKVSAVLDGSTISARHSSPEGLHVTINGREAVLKTQPQQILNLLISTYENAVQQNQNLARAQAELRELNLQLQEKLREIQNSEERFESLVRTIPDIVYKIDAEGRFLFLNEAVRFLGYEPEDLLGTHFSELVINSEEVARDSVLPGYEGRQTGEKQSPKLFDERRTGDRMTRALEVLLARKGQHGETTPALLESIGRDTVVVELNSSGLYEVDQGKTEKAFVGSVGVIRDITERKQTEQELQRLTQTLLAKERLAMLGQLVGSVNHELRNPLGVISNSVYFLKRHLKELDPKTDKHLNLLQREVQVCTTLISEFLDLSNLRKAPAQAEVEFPEVLDRALEVLTIPDGITLSSKLAPDLPPLFVDVDQVRRVLMNLLVNAIQAMPSGGPLLVEARRSGSFCEVRVSDSGIGIPEENLGKVFESLFTTKTRGVGLGLAIVKEIVENHQGSISVESAPGKGTTFTFTLPLFKGKNGVK